MGKTKVNIQNMIIAALMAAGAASPAFAVTPKTDHTIMHDQVTLGDVFDGVTENADYVLAPAPAAGKTLILTVNDLTRISDAFHLEWTPEDKLQRVTIRRSSHEIDNYDIQAALQQRLIEETNGQRFELVLTDPSVRIRLPDGAEKDVTVNTLSYDAVKGEFKAVVVATAAPQTKKEINGRIYAISQLPVLKDPLRQGDVISSSDIEYVDIRTNAISANMIVDANKLVGQTPRRGIAAMKPVMLGDVQAPLVVKKGDLVTMVLKSNIISLTAQGRAMENGAAGDTIRVMNTSSKQVLGATVTGPQTVNIKAPSGALAANTL